MGSQRRCKFPTRLKSVARRKEPRTQPEKPPPATLSPNSLEAGTAPIASIRPPMRAGTKRPCRRRSMAGAASSCGTTRERTISRGSQAYGASPAASASPGWPRLRVGRQRSSPTNIRTWKRSPSPSGRQTRGRQARQGAVNLVPVGGERLRCQARLVLQQTTVTFVSRSVLLPMHALDSLFG